jgi:nucleotide-binding universal stress UspA family protein
MAGARADRTVRAMFRTIVVGYDGPERGGEAIALAEALRDPRHGSLLLTSAYLPAAVPAAPFVITAPDLRDPTDASLAEARARLEGRVPVRTISVPAAPARALTETAEREHADLVVVGSSHHGAAGRVVPGTTAERLLHGAPCAVAVAPRGYEGGEIRHIGVAYEGSPEAEAALRAAEALALELGAALTVYCVVEPPPATASMIAAGTGAEWPSVTAKQHARQLLYYVTDHAPQGVRPETVLLHGHAGEQIARRTAGVVDLLFAGSRGYGPLRRALLGSVSGALVRDAGCPVVITARSALVAARGLAPHAEAAKG